MVRALRAGGAAALRQQAAIEAPAEPAPWSPAALSPPVLSRRTGGAATAAMNFGLIIIGDEILSGKRQDKHLPKVIELLAARGLALSWARYVGDDRSAITPELHDAFASGDVVFCCGGIGATPDDHTRQCAAAALGVPLVLHPRGARTDPGAHARRGRRAGPALRAGARRTTCTG